MGKKINKTQNQRHFISTSENIPSCWNLRRQPTNEKNRHTQRARRNFYTAAGLKCTNLLSLWSLGTLADLEFNQLVFLKVAEASTLNFRVVNEEISGAIVWSDETVALFAVEPFHSSLCHICTFSYVGDATSVSMIH